MSCPSLDTRDDLLPVVCRSHGASGPHLLRRMLATIRLWRQRIEGREALARLSEIELRDLHFSQSDVAGEIRKPFWRE